MSQAHQDMLKAGDPHALAVVRIRRLLLMLAVGTGAFIVFRLPLPQVSLAIVGAAVGMVALGLVSGLVTSGTSVAVIVAGIARFATGQAALSARKGRSHYGIHEAIRRTGFILIALNLLGPALGYVVGCSLADAVGAMILHKKLAGQNPQAAEGIANSLLAPAGGANLRLGFLLILTLGLSQAGLGLSRYHWAAMLLGGVLFATLVTAAAFETRGRLRRRHADQPVWPMLLAPTVMALAGLLGLNCILASAQFG